MQDEGGMDSPSPVACGKEKNLDMDYGKKLLSHYVLGQACNAFQNGLKSKQLMIPHKWDWGET